MSVLTPVRSLMTELREAFVEASFAPRLRWLAFNAAIAAFWAAICFWSCFCWAYASDRASARALGGGTVANRPPARTTTMRAEIRPRPTRGRGRPDQPLGPMVGRRRRLGRRLSSVIVRAISVGAGVPVGSLAG